LANGARFWLTARRLPVAALLGCVGAADAPSFHLSGTPVQGALVRGSAPAGTVALSLDGREVPLAADGRFLLGFDRDARPSASLVARAGDGGEIRATLQVGRRAWSIQHINMPRPANGPTPEYARLRAGELQLIGRARGRLSPSMGWSQRFMWPARGRLSGAFGAQRIYRGGVPAAYHSGADIAAGAGALVIAPADGVVTLAPPPGFSLEGNLVILDHGMGLTSSFLHLSSALVRPGQVVHQGDPIGRVGATGRATGPHLHWSLVWNGARVDPATVASPL
jgi:murein DD-endopeptidase MepM/ murein hydrolase activator NlpD